MYILESNFYEDVESYYIDDLVFLTLINFIIILEIIHFYAFPILYRY